MPIPIPISGLALDYPAEEARAFEDSCRHPRGLVTLALRAVGTTAFTARRGTMRRRELLKVLAAVPFATAIGGCEEKGEKDEKQRGKRTSTVEIHLDGTFALVLQRNKGNSLMAFSPKPPS